MVNPVTQAFGSMSKALQICVQAALLPALLVVAGGQRDQGLKKGRSRVMGLKKEDALTALRDARPAALPRLGLC